jgi:uncharacterized protein (DUF58 family)
MPERIFDEKTFRKLERLTLVAHKVRAGAIKGERRSSRRGTSIEFADYRNYVRGDDLRRVDWNIYARLQRPFIKLLEDEEDLAVHLLLDASDSMDWPRSDDGHNKYLFARRILAGLAYIALGTGDRVTVTALRQEAPLRWGPLRGRSQVLSLLDWLEKLDTYGPVDFNQVLRDYALRTARAGLCVVLSDLLSESGYEDGLRALQGRGYEVVVIQVLSPDEVKPQMIGDLKLIDVETGLPQDVTLDAGMYGLYEQRFQAWRTEIGAYCIRRGIHYISVETDTPWEQLILSELRRSSVVR